MLQDTSAITTHLLAYFCGWGSISSPVAPAKLGTFFLNNIPHDPQSPRKENTDSKNFTGRKSQLSSGRGKNNSLERERPSYKHAFSPVSAGSEATAPPGGGAACSEAACGFVL